MTSFATPLNPETGLEKTVGIKPNNTWKKNCSTLFSLPEPVYAYSWKLIYKRFILRAIVLLDLCLNLTFSPFTWRPERFFWPFLRKHVCFGYTRSTGPDQRRSPVQVWWAEQTQHSVHLEHSELVTSSPRTGIPGTRDQLTGIRSGDIWKTGNEPEVKETMWYLIRNRG